MRILGVADSSTVTDSLQSGGGRVGRGGHPSSCRSIKKALFAQWSELKTPSAERLEALAAMLDDSLPSPPLLLARFDFLQSKFNWQTGQVSFFVFLLQSRVSRPSAGGSSYSASSSWPPGSSSTTFSSNLSAAVSLSCSLRSRPR